MSPASGDTPQLAVLRQVLVTQSQGGKQEKSCCVAGVSREAALKSSADANTANYADFTWSNEKALSRCRCL